MTKYFFLLACSCALLTSCYYDVEAELYNNTCDVPAAPTYTADVQSIVTNKCATSGCHVTGGTGTGNFETFAGVLDKVQNGTFEQEVVVDLTMPPSGGMSQCEIDIISAWIANGAVE